MPEIVDISRFEAVGEVNVPPIYLTYPSLYQRELIPERARAILERSWTTDRTNLPKLQFFKVKNVYVACEGLVFTEAGALIAQSRTAHSEADITGAHAMLLNMLANGSPITRHENGVLCKKRGAENYGHWLVEMLPKAYWARKSTPYKGWPIVVHETSGALRSVIGESLEAIGIAPSEILETGRTPAFFAELLMVEGLTSHAIFISPFVMECMDEIAAKSDSSAADKLYVLRRPAKSRDFEDETAARHIFLKQGYTEIETANMTFLDQVRAFKSARHVVGPMGAALTNIIFCKPGAEILVFMPASALELFYWLIAEGRKLSYHEVRCQEAGEQVGSLSWNRALRISSSAIETVLARLKQLRLAPLMPLEAVETEPALPALTRADICGATWEWKFSTHENPIRGVKLESDGTIRGYDHPNEHSWQLSGNILEILSADGKCSWRFDQTIKLDEMLELRASFRLPHPSEVFLTIKSERH